MRTIVLAALALAACSPEPDAGDEQLTTLPANGVGEDHAPPPQSQPLSPVETLAGEWRVAGIDGEPLDETYGIALSANGEEIWWEPRCANIAFAYTINGLRISTGGAEPALPVEPGAPPPPVCTIAIPPRLAEVGRALDLAETAGRTPSNGVLIEGRGHSLTLFSQ